MRLPGLAEIRTALPEGARTVVASVLEAAHGRELPVFLVGGPARDLLLARPLQDVDLVVETGTPEDVASLAREVAPVDARVVWHGRFGTAAIRTASGAGVDLVASRRESYPRDGALPKVEPGDLLDDLRRRDFTVNAMAIPLSRVARRRGPGLVDPTGGAADLERRVLRVLHRDSFRDDPTRAFRAARLAPRLGFTLARDAGSALRHALRSGSFGGVSGDRLRGEVARIFADAILGLDPAEAFRNLSRWHVLPALEPGLELPKASVLPLRRLGREIARPAWRTRRQRPWLTGLALWLAPLPAGLRRRALRRLSVRGETAARVESLVATRAARLRGLERARGRGQIDALLGHLSEEELQALYAWSPPAGRRRIQRYASEDQRRRLPVTGDDLLDIGLSGPALGRALDGIRVAFLDGSVRTRDEAVALAREIARVEGRRRAKSR